MRIFEKEYKIRFNYLEELNKKDKEIYLKLTTKEVKQLSEMIHTSIKKSITLEIRDQYLETHVIRPETIDKYKIDRLVEVDDDK